jgi:HTH-type transcriptional regulator/antitoxin HigA
MVTEKDLHSNLAIPPGEFLEEIMQDLKLSTADVAASLECEERFLTRLIQGQEAITEALAVKLHEMTKVPANLWMGLEEEYRETLWRNAQKRKPANSSFTPRSL